MPVDLIARAHHGGIAAVLLFPDAIAHHRHQRCALLIIGIVHHAPDPGIDAEGAEEIAGDVLPVAGICRSLRSGSTHAQRRIARLQSRQVAELRRVGAKMLVHLPGE